MSIIAISEGGYLGLGGGQRGTVVRVHSPPPDADARGTNRRRPPRVGTFQGEAREGSRTPDGRAHSLRLTARAWLSLLSLFIPQFSLQPSTTSGTRSHCPPSALRRIRGARWPRRSIRTTARFVPHPVDSVEKFSSLGPFFTRRQIRHHSASGSLLAHTALPCQSITSKLQPQPSSARAPAPSRSGSHDHPPRQ